jgi:hypothetical protein
MVVGTYRELFAAIAATGGSLTGLLFVALSVAPRGVLVSGPRVVRQIRAAAAILAFTNALVVSLYGLVPTTNIGYPAVISSLVGLFFSAAALRSILAIRLTRAQLYRQLVLLGLLVLIFGAELVAGIVVLARPSSTTAIQYIGYAVVTALVVGIARAWELVGERDTGISASLAVLTGHDPATSEELPPAGTQAEARPPEDNGLQ